MGRRGQRYPAEYSKHSSHRYVSHTTARLGNIKGRGECLLKSAKEKSKDLFIVFQMILSHSVSYVFGMSLTHSSLQIDKLNQSIYRDY